MDPVTAIGLAASVQQLLMSLFNYTKDTINAKEEIRRLNAEISLLKAALEQLQIISSTPSQLPEGSTTSGSVFLTPNFETVEFRAMIASTEDLLRELLKMLEPKTTSNKQVQYIKQTLQRAKWHLDKRQAQDFINRVERSKSWFILALTTDETLYCREMFSEICSIKEALKSQEVHQGNQELAESQAKLASWLAPYSPHDTYMQSLERFQEGTGGWFLDGVCQEWMDGSHSSILWLKAQPGFGKTTLMAAAIRKALSLQTDTRAVAYSFCSFAEQQSQDLGYILGSLIIQLCNHSPLLWQKLIDQYSDVLSREKSRHERPKLEELMDLLVTCSEQTGSAVIFVDAINESVAPDIILKCFKELVKKTTSIKILLSSTEDTVIHAFDLGDSGKGNAIAFVPIKGTSNLQDIEVYINARIESNWRLRQLQTSLKTEIVSTLLAKAHGVFRWVQCQLDQLSDRRWTRTVGDVRKALKALPVGLEKTYEQMLTRILEDNEADLVKPALFWLCFSYRPLSLEELCEAVVLPPDGGEINDESRLQWPQDLVRACSSLVRYASYIPARHSNPLILGHSSVSEYLTSEKIRSSPVSFFYLDRTTANSVISKLCLEYLLRPELEAGYCTTPEAFNTRLRDSPLLTYIADALWKHLRDVNLDGPLRLLILRFLKSQHLPRRGNFGSWVQVYNPTLSLRNIEDSTVLYWAAREGQLSLVKMILEVEGKENLELGGGMWGSTPLHVACWAGQKEIVKELIAAGANVHERNRNGETGLLWATWQGYEDIEKLLKDAGAGRMRYRLAPKVPKKV